MIKGDLEVNKIYILDGKKYHLVGEFKMKMPNGGWQDSILYANATGEPKTYGRTKENFFERFSELDFFDPDRK